MATHDNPYPSAFNQSSKPHGQHDGDERKPKRRKKKRKIWWWLAGLAVLIFLSVGIGFYVFLEKVKAGKFGELPGSEILENPENPLATGVYTADGQLLGKYYKEKRTSVSFDELSPNLVEALIATEDERFMEHAGIDFKALFRVAVKTVLMGQSSSGGGSTISQQLAKNLFELRKIHPNNNIGIQKLQEWVIATRLEKQYTKQEILTMYLNTVNFLQGAYGIYEAAHTYFGKTPSELDKVESAALVAMLKAPSTYNICSNPSNNADRRKVVFALMARNGFVSFQDTQRLNNAQLKAVCETEDHNTGSAQYFREQLRMRLHEWGRNNGYDVYRDGLRVYTTLDSRVQAHAEAAAQKHMRYLQKKFDEHWEGWNKLPWVDELSIRSQVIHSNRYHYYRKRYAEQNKAFTEEEIAKVFSEPREMTVFSYRGSIDTVMTPMDSVHYHHQYLQCGFMAMEPETGQILAWVGGINQKHFKYDHVNKRAKRQVGSTFKPIVFLTGLEHNYNPCDRVANVPVVFEFSTGIDEETGEEIIETWSPKNADGKYGGFKTIQQGLANSINCITAYVMKQVGPQAVVKRAHELGIESHMEAVPSLCLGTAEISVTEMVSVFNTFNNGGVWVEPIMITRIEDRFGNLIEEFNPERSTVIDEYNNYAMVRMLQRVVQRGTGMRLISSNYYNIRTPMAGKTGTTQDAADGWFIGFQPGLTAGCWVGGEIRQVAFRDMRYGQGARMALPIFGEFMVAVNSDSTLNYGTATQFPKPPAELPFDMSCPDIEYDPDNPDDTNGEDGGGTDFNEGGDPGF